VASSVNGICNRFLIFLSFAYVFDGRRIILVLARFFIPVTVFTESFYRNKEGQSHLEEQVRLYLTQQSPNPIVIKALLNSHGSWGVLEKFYYTTIPDAIFITILMCCMIILHQNTIKFFQKIFPLQRIGYYMAFIAKLTRVQCLKCLYKHLEFLSAGPSKFQLITMIAHIYLSNKKMLFTKINVFLNR